YGFVHSRLPLCHSGARVSANPESRDSGFASSRRPGMTSILIDDPHRHRTDAADEIRIEPLHRTCDVEAQVALQDLLPENTQLLLGKPVADTAMDARAKGKMLPHLRPIDDELVSAFDLVVVAIAGDVPHHDLVALGDLLAAKLGIAPRGAAHVQHRRMIADDFGDQ